MKRNKYIILIFFFIISFHVIAQRGKDGIKVVSAANTIVNEYTSLTADAYSGTSSIVVANNTLNTNNRFSGPLGAGDLIIIIQVQGATIRDSVQTREWGKILNYKNCGLYEFAEVHSVKSNDTINISCGLLNNYTNSGKVLVVRVPRYRSLTINNGGVLTSDTWNGTIGGILSVEVLDNIVINSGGKIDLTGKGFRGGILNDNIYAWGIGEYYYPTNDYGAEKGEGIAGFETDYDAIGGRYCRGAAANGGGGANTHNHGGGGGANAGDTSLWTGLGNPDTSTANWKQAWDLEGAGFANSTSSSSGGGRGGYSFSSSNQNALILGPWNTNGNSNAWGGDWRRFWGGLGGRPLDYSTGRIYMGGGGGAGEQNDGWGSSGANGGGIVFIMSYKDVTGSGKIISNGANAPNSTSGTGIGSTGADGAGGGGAGGTIIIKSTGNITVDSIIANGGRGGNQVINAYYNSTQTQAEGPGGGGGGGYIAISNGSPKRLAKGGHNGTTNSSGLTEFIHNGATKGGYGIDSAKISIFNVIAINDTICAGDSATLSASLVGSFPPGTTITWYDAPINGNILDTGTVFVTPPLTTTTSYYVGSCPGTFNAVVIAVVNTPVADAGANVQICAGGNVQLNASGGVIYHWAPSQGLSDTTIYNPVASPTSTTTYYVTVTNSTGCSTFDSVKVTVGTLHANAGNDVSICPGDSASLQASGGVSYSWSPVSGLSNPNIFNPKASPANTTTYIVTVSDGMSCSAVDSVIVSVYPAAVVNAGNDDTICPGSSIQLNASGSGTSYIWTPPANLSNPNIYDPIANPPVTTTYTVNVANSNGCKAKDSVTIYVIQSVDAAFSSTTACIGDSMAFTDHSTSTAGNITSWFWNFGDGYSSSIKNPYHFYTSIGQYTVTLYVTNAAGCKDSITQTVTVNPTPLANYALSDTSGCEPLSVAFTDQSVGANNWTWNFDDPGSGSSNTSIIQNPTHVFQQPGSYNIVLSVGSSSNCSSNITQTVHVYPSANAQFTASPNPVFINNPVTITNTSSNGSTYFWNFGNGQTSSLQNPSVTYTTPGTYTISLITTSADGCKDSTTYVITVNDEINLVFPNIITPNGDGKNDFFVITDLEKIPTNHLIIFNRWGKVVYEKDNYLNNWNGGKLSDGVYYFILTYLNKETHGTLTIIR